MDRPQDARLTGNSVQGVRRQGFKPRSKTGAIYARRRGDGFGGFWHIGSRLGGWSRVEEKTEIWLTGEFAFGEKGEKVNRRPLARKVNR